MMQFEIILHGNETPEQINRCVAALSAYAGKSSKVGEVNLELRVNADHAILELERLKAAAGDLKLPDSVGEKLEVELLNKLEAENPQFGKQPLPEGGVHFTAHNEVSSDPLAPPTPPSPPSAPSPAAAAPSTSAPVVAPGSSVDVDKNGFPWDERIHASSRAKIADGSWRMKRGVQQHVVDEVEAQLRGQSSPLGDFVRSSGAERTAIGQKVAAAVDAAMPPGPPAPPAAPVAGAGLTFGQLAKRVGAKITLGELTAQDLAAKMAALGFPGGLHEANARPDMWATILETLGA